MTFSVIHFIVPTPEVTVNTTYTPPLYVGSAITLTCTVILDPNVDNYESVTTTWSGPSDITGDRYMVTAARGSGTTHTGILTISPLSDEDDGIYTCTGTVTGQNIQQTVATNTHTLPTIRKPSFILTFFHGSLSL